MKKLLFLSVTVLFLISATVSAQDNINQTTVKSGNPSFSVFSQNQQKNSPDGNQPDYPGMFKHKGFIGLSRFKGEFGWNMVLSTRTGKAADMSAQIDIYKLSQNSILINSQGHMGTFSKETSYSIIIIPIHFCGRKSKRLKHFKRISTYMNLGLGMVLAKVTKTTTIQRYFEVLTESISKEKITRVGSSGFIAFGMEINVFRSFMTDLNVKYIYSRFSWLIGERKVYDGFSFGIGIGYAIHDMH